MTEKKTDGPTPGEALVAQGALVIQIENAEMRSFALAHRRVEADVKKQALAQLEADPEAAESAYYTIPFKKHRRGDADCTGRSDDPCPVESDAEGIGIEGARELARLWTNNASRVYFTDEDDAEWIRLSGVFVDLETNTRTEVPLGVSRVQTYAGGAAYTLSPGQLAMAIQAGVSKVARNAIVQALPRHLSRAYWQRAKQITMGRGAVDTAKLVEAFAVYNVTQEMLEALYGCPLAELTPDQRGNLRGLFVAVREDLVDPKKHFDEAGVGAAGGAPDGTGAASQSQGVTSPASATADVESGTTAADAPGAQAPTGPQDEQVSKAGETREKAGPATGPLGSPKEDEAERPEPEQAPYTGGLAPEGIPEPSPKQKTPFGRPPDAWELEQEPAAAPSQPSPSGVQSEAPNDDETEPEQPTLKGLGI